MISVAEAREIVTAVGLSVPVGDSRLINAGGRILAEDVYAPVDHPVFDQSAVDGYAIHFEDLRSGNPLKVVGEMAAGASPDLLAEKGEALRIFTGAAVPGGPDTVVMQEFCERDGEWLTVKDPGLKKGGNIRKKGEQIGKGKLALEKGTRLNASAIGFLASLGISRVPVADLPLTGILVTGNEFAENPEDLTKGKIFESNGEMLTTALSGLGLQSWSMISGDSIAEMRSKTEDLTMPHHILLVTGGVSVGDYDFTRDFLEEMGYDIVFHKIRQKPGKPMLFANRGGQVAFGLPGNPRSAMICFYMYVLPCIYAMMGAKNPYCPTIKMPLAHEIKKREGRSQFLAVRFVPDGVESMEGQGSHMLQSLGLADALVWLPENEANFKRAS